MSNILDEAKQTVIDRAAQYDVRENNFERIATFWSVVFGRGVTRQEVALCLILLKVARDIYKPSRDNCVDIAGYADCLAEVNGYYDEKQTSCTEAEVCNPAPWQGRPNLGPIITSEHRFRNVVTCNAESDAGRGQDAGLCFCGKSEGQCDWPACSNYVAPKFKAC